MSPFLFRLLALLEDLSLPHDAQNLSASHLPPLDRLAVRPQLGAVVGIVPAVTPATRAAAGWKGEGGPFLGNARPQPLDLN